MIRPEKKRRQVVVLKGRVRQPPTPTPVGGGPYVLTVDDAWLLAMLEL